MDNKKFKQLTFLTPTMQRTGSEIVLFNLLSHIPDNFYFRLFSVYKGDLLRFIHKHQIKLAYLPEFIIKMRVGGKSNASLKNRLRANNEDKKAWKINGLNPYFYTMYLKPLRKIIQLFKK